MPLKFVLYFHISTFCSICSVPNMAVFCSSLISCFPGMLLRYCQSDLEMVPVGLIIIGITFPFTFHMHWIFITRSWHFKIFSASFLITFLSPGIAISIKMHVPCLSSQIMMSCYKFTLRLLLFCCCCLWSQVFSPCYFSPWTNSDPHRPDFKFQTGVLSILCVMFQV